MVHDCRSPAVGCMAVITGGWRWNMLIWLTLGSTSIVTGKALGSNTVVVHNSRGPAICAVATVTGIWCRNMGGWFAFCSTPIMAGKAAGGYR